MKVIRSVLHSHLFRLTGLFCVICFFSVEIAAMKVSEKYSRKQKEIAEQQKMTPLEWLEQCINQLNSVGPQKVQEHSCFVILCSAINKIGNYMVQMIKTLQNKSLSIDNIPKIKRLTKAYVMEFVKISPAIQLKILEKLQQNNEKYDVIQNFIELTERVEISQEWESATEPIEKLFNVIFSHYLKESQIREKFEELSKKSEQSFWEKFWGWFGKK
jgi:hypothetical protein